jgi:Mrp family chromosome partitioning ATPase
MSAIDNAFIRAYTLDTAAAPAPAASDYDEQTAFDSAGPTVAESQRAVAEKSSIAARSSRRAVGSTNPTAVAQTISQPATAVASSRRTQSAASVKAPTNALTSASAESVVPAPHIRLASFIHTTTTLDPSPTIGSAAFLELPTSSLPAAQFDPPDAESVAEESPTAESVEVSADASEVDSPALVNSRPRHWQTALASATWELAAPPIAPPSLPSTLPFSSEVAARSEAEAEPPRAAFEVDRFTWPDVCDALLEKQAGEFDQLIGQLVTESALGRKIVAITGSRRGDGRTTLALLLARRLAATAVKVVVVDADFEVPQLAARLGMTIQSGWENVLTDGLPVWEGLVESLADRVALLPLAPRLASNVGQPTATEFVARHAEAIRQHLDALRKHFDVVLVDAGAIKAVRPDAKPRGPLALAGCLDAAITVSDVRTTAPDRIADLQRRLLEARIVPLGIAENFCPPKSDGIES